MNTQVKINLAPKDLETIRDILKQNLNNIEVWAFGSRVNGGAKKFSDLDLALINKSEIPLLTMAKLREAFSESNLTIKVDLVDWAHIDEGFREMIKQKHLVIWSG